MINEVEQKMFEKYGVVESKPCQFNLGCGHAVPCNQCERPLVFPSVTFTKIYMLEEIITRHYNVLILDRLAGFITLTACPAPSEDLGADEAYFRVEVKQPNKSDAICELITKVYDDLTEQERIEVKNILEAS